MANPSKTLLLLIVDRSGSMRGRHEDASGGINTLIKEQAANPVGSCDITLVQFDDKYEVVHRAQDAKTIPEYTLVPRGQTALLDAVGRGVVETGEYLAALDEDQRPGLVAVTIVTDGHENDSKEYTKAKVRELIQHQTEKYGWQFQFLGADISAFDEAEAMGIDPNKAAQYDPNKSTRAVYATTSSSLGRARAASAQGLAPDAVAAAMSYTVSERETLKSGELPPSSSE